MTEPDSSRATDVTIVLSAPFSDGRPQLGFGGRQPEETTTQLTYKSGFGFFALIAHLRPKKPAVTEPEQFIEGECEVR